MFAVALFISARPRSAVGRIYDRNLLWNLNDGITVNMLGLRLVVGNVVLSLRAGGGDAVTRGLNEVRRQINGGALRNTYIQ